jgi:hypothetical protein
MPAGSDRRTVFACTGCHAPLTSPLSRVVLPAHAGQRYGYGLLDALMAPGTFAVDPEPYGPPWRRWAEVGAAEAEARGVYAPVSALSYGPRKTIVVPPGDVLGTTFIAGRLDGGCCGLDGRDGLNLACSRCGQPVATRIDDCGHWHATRLDPTAVYASPAPTDPVPITSWETLASDRPGTPPVEPSGWRSPQWEAAIAVTGAYLLAASTGRRITVPGGPLADTFGRLLDALLPPGPGTTSLALAGPGLPTVSAAISLVPQHPQTGDLWPQPATVRSVPLSWDVWAYLAYHRERRPVPGAGTMPSSALRDDPLPLHPSGRLEPDREIFSDTLARLPEVKQPWLRQIYDYVRTRPYTHQSWVTPPK